MSHPQRPVRDAFANVAGTLMAGITVILGLVLVATGLLPGELDAARREGWPPSGMTAGAAGGLGCYATPTPTPTPTPSPGASLDPSLSPNPGFGASPEPTAEPTFAPSEVLSQGPNDDQSAEPVTDTTRQLRPDPTEPSIPAPSPEPTAEPTPEPTTEPTPEPTPRPTPEPTPERTVEPTPDATPAASPEARVVSIALAARATDVQVGRRAKARLDQAAPSLEPGVSPSPEPTSTPPPTPNPTPTPAPTRPRGIDISKWDGAVDMGLVRSAGISFVISKATQGSSITDAWYSDHIAAARAAGLAVGSYHFFDYRTGGVAQADHFVDTMAANGALVDALPPVVDVECLASLGQSDRPKARSRLRALVDRIYQRTGRIAAIYTSAHMWGHVTGNDLTFGENPLWVACWSCGTPILPSGWDRWTFWQRGPISIPGISRRFDGNVSWGTDTTLQALRSKPMVVAADAPMTRVRTLPIEIQGLDGSHIRTAMDAQEWSSWVPRASAGRVTIEGADGTRTVQVQARDERGTLGPVVSDDIVLDATAPIADAPRVGIRDGSLSLSGAAIPVRVAWSATDPGSGVVTARIRAACDGVSIVDVDTDLERGASRGSMADVLDARVAANARCSSSATVTDAAGNTTAADALAVTVLSVPDSPSARLAYSSGWKRVARSSASGGSVRSSSTRNSWARLRFTGTEIALVAVRGPARGRVRISIDGTVVKTLELRAKTISNRRIVFRQRLGAGRHTLEVRVMGTAPVEIDGFIVIGP